MSSICAASSTVRGTSEKSISSGGGRESHAEELRFPFGKKIWVRRRKITQHVFGKTASVSLTLSAFEKSGSAAESSERFSSVSGVPVKSSRRDIAGYSAACERHVPGKEHGWKFFCKGELIGRRKRAVRENERSELRQTGNRGAEHVRRSVLNRNALAFPVEAFLAERDCPVYPHFGQGILQRENGGKIAAGAHISFFEIFQPCKRRNVLRGEIRRYDAFALSVEALSADGDVPENGARPETCFLSSAAFPRLSPVRADRWYRRCAL